MFRKKKTPKPITGHSQSAPLTTGDDGTSYFIKSGDVVFGPPRPLGIFPKTNPDAKKHAELFRLVLARYRSEHK